jgi:exocyst complex component 2
MTDPGAVFKHYRLKDPFPTSWTDPVEDVQHKQRVQRRQSTVRYSILQEERSSTFKGLVDDEYEDATVLLDESDPLGTTNSVVRVLKKRGLPVEDNVRLR